MNKFVAGLQIVGSGILALTAIATLINLVLISTRPETISVVNTLIGQGVIIIFLAAFSRILFRRGRAGLRAAADGEDSEH